MMAKRWIDLAGERFGSLVAIEMCGRDDSGGVLWRLKCDCGQERITSAHSLVRGHVKSCGCYKKNRKTAGETDLAGRRFGKLIVIEFYEQDKHSHGVWTCACDCGNTVNVSRNTLMNGSCQSCGCLQRERASKANKLDVSGSRFGRLVALYNTGEKASSSAHYLWACQCDCGKIAKINISSLLNGTTKSCGCYRDEMRGKSNITHGLSKTPAYIRMIANRRREWSAELDSEWTPEMETELSEMFAQCVICGSAENLQTDHVRPLSMGFGLNPGNAARLCRHCNCSKRHTDVYDMPFDKRDKILEAAEAFRLYWENNHG